MFVIEKSLFLIASACLVYFSSLCGMIPNGSEQLQKCSVQMLHSDSEN